MSEVIRFFLACLIPISLFGMAAFLIFKDAPGWGWFLFCTVLVVDSLSIKMG